MKHLKISVANAMIASGMLGFKIPDGGYELLKIPASWNGVCRIGIESGASASSTRVFAKDTIKAIRAYKHTPSGFEFDVTANSDGIIVQDPQGHETTLYFRGETADFPLGMCIAEIVRDSTARIIKQWKPLATMDRYPLHGRGAHRDLSPDQITALQSATRVAMAFQPISEPGIGILPKIVGATDAAELNAMLAKDAINREMQKIMPPKLDPAVFRLVVLALNAKSALTAPADHKIRLMPDDWSDISVAQQINAQNPGMSIVAADVAFVRETMDIQILSTAEATKKILEIFSLQLIAAESKLSFATQDGACALASATEILCKTARRLLGFIA